MEVILSISFKMTAESEIRKHKLMFCFLLRGRSGYEINFAEECVGFVSHMFFHCHEMRLHCFLPSVAWLVPLALEKRDS